MKDKTKEELIEIIEELKADKDELKFEISLLQEERNDLEEEVENLNNQIDDLEISNGIKDIENFLWILRRDDYNLFEKSKPFIDNYLKFYNN